MYVCMYACLYASPRFLDSRAIHIYAYDIYVYTPGYIRNSVQVREREGEDESERERDRERERARVCVRSCARVRACARARARVLEKTRVLSRVQQPRRLDSCLIRIYLK